MAITSLKNQENAKAIQSKNKGCLCLIISLKLSGIFTKILCLLTVLPILPLKRYDILTRLKRAKYSGHISEKNEDKKTLNIPHYISSFYPVILEDKPRVILHGYFNSNTGDCYYTIATRLIKNINVVTKRQMIYSKAKEKSKLATALNLSTLYLFKDIKSISKKVARVAYKPTSISSHVAKDMKSVKPLFSLPDYKKIKLFRSIYG